MYNMKPVVDIFNYRIRLNHFLIFLFCYLIMEPIFSWFIIRNGFLINRYEQILSLGIFFLLIAFFQQLKRSEKYLVVIFTLLILKLVIESLLEHNSVLIHFELFVVLFPILYVIFIRNLFKFLDIDILEFIVKFYVAVYFLFMIVFGKDFSLIGTESLSLDLQLGPFSGDTRIVHAKSILIMIVPFLFFLNKFIENQRPKALFWLLLCLLILSVHQHRSVWVSAIFAATYFIFLFLKNKQGYNLRILNLLVVLFLFLGLLLVIVSSIYPNLISYFGERFGEIVEPNKEGTTGSFRGLQREVYLGLFLDKPLFGWSFEGYRMPNPIVDWWPANTGQHFHEGYVEILFYHGIVGLLLKYAILIVIFLRSFKRRLSSNSAILISFCLSGLLFSLAYVPPLMFWGMVGLCLFYLDKDEAMELQLESIPVDTSKNS